MYTITDALFYNLIQYTLLETPNNGVSFGSGLYSTTELTKSANYRLDLFNKLTSMQVASNVVDPVTLDVKNQVATNVTDAIDILEVAYKPSSTWHIIPPGSANEADAYVGDQVGTNAAVEVPYFYTIDTTPLLTISLYPPPNASGSLRMRYVQKIGLLPSTPDGTTIRLADDFVPYVKFGVLADMFRKSGETYDPLRADICEQLFELGAEVGRAWVSGSQK